MIPSQRVEWKAILRSTNKSANLITIQAGLSVVLMIKTSTHLSHILISDCNVEPPRFFLNNVFLVFQENVALGTHKSFLPYYVITKIQP